MDKPLYACFTKATTSEKNVLQYGTNWLLSRRARLKVFPTHLQCGNWIIYYDAIQSATLYSFRSFLSLIPGYVLQIETKDKRYSFGLNSNKFWKDELPFPVKREKVKLTYSWFSIGVRAVALGGLIYYLFSQ